MFGNTICVAIALASLFYETSAINCFYCNSANNSACLDLEVLEPELRTRIIPVVHCETAIPSPVAVNFFCRKIVQTIFYSQRNLQEVRVTRGCGWVKHHKPCYKADNADHLETVCQCFEDHCNSGFRMKSTFVTAIVGLFSALRIFAY